MSKNSILKKLALIAAGAMILPAFAAADIKMGIILGFTGPIESLTPDMAIPQNWPSKKLRTQVNY